MQLFAFVKADLTAYQPQPGLSAGFAESDEPVHPKSLLLLRPLFETYELNPVNPAAQAAIPPPDDIDLDAWIVPPPKPEVLASASSDLAKKSKKGKGKAKAKDVNGSVIRSSRRRKSAEDGAVLASEVEETAEEHAAREQVRQYWFCQGPKLITDRQEPSVSNDSETIRIISRRLRTCVLRRQKT